MIRRLNDNTLVEFKKSHNGKASWRFIVTDKATREFSLSVMQLKKIRRWEKEFLDHSLS